MKRFKNVLGSYIRNYPGTANEISELQWVLDIRISTFLWRWSKIIGDECSIYNWLIGLMGRLLRLQNATKFLISFI